MSDQMIVVSFRIPSKLKRRMRRIRKNWSFVVRESIENEIKEDKKHEALERIDAILARTPSSKRGAAARYIREDRDSH